MTDTTTQTIVKADGRTTCCNAYTSISIDDGVEYCKACYEAVVGYEDAPTQRVTVTLDDTSTYARLVEHLDDVDLADGYFGDA